MIKGNDLRNMNSTLMNLISFQIIKLIFLFYKKEGLDLKLFDANGFSADL